MSTESLASFQQKHIQEDINSGERCMVIWLVCYYIRRIHHSIDVDCSVVRSNNYIGKRIIISCIRFIISSAWILIPFAQIIKLSAQFIFSCARNIVQTNYYFVIMDYYIVRSDYYIARTDYYIVRTN